MSDRHARRQFARELVSVLEAMDDEPREVVFCVIDAFVHGNPFVLAFDGSTMDASLGCSDQARALAARYREQLRAELRGRNVPLAPLSSDGPLQ